MQLDGLSEHIDEFAKLGATLVGISTDSVKMAGSLRERLDLPFPLLSDPERAAIDRYGVADAARELAVPAVFVIRRDGAVHWRYVSGAKADRPDPAQILQQVKAATQ